MIPDPCDRPTLKVAEAAAYLGVSDETVYAAAQAGDLPSLRLGRRVLIVTAGLRRLLLLDQGLDGGVSAVSTPVAPVRSA